MAVTFNRLLIVALLLSALASCSLAGRQQDAKRSSTEIAFASNTETKDTPGVCLPEVGSPFHLRKVLLLAGTIGVSDVSRDLPGLPKLTSKRLQEHLDALQRFNVRAMHDVSFRGDAHNLYDLVKQIGRKHAAQFVVKLEIEDLTVHQPNTLLGYWLKNRAQRNVSIRLFIYDTEYGALFFTKQYTRRVSGNVVGYRGNSSTITPAWFNTTLGQEIDEILHNISKDISDKLACIPFSTKVTAIKGDDIHINAGHQQGIRPGETLRVYRRSNLLTPAVMQKQIKSEMWIKVNTVFPNHSIASATQSTQGDVRLNTGDVVRAW